MENLKPRLLIVEDEPAIRTGLVDVFLFHGFAVTEAADGPSGLQHALTGKFDLILLDVMLPGKNGYDLCAELREHDKETAIIMLTAKSADDDIIYGLKLGADDYVAKPFSVAQLVSRAQAVLRRTRKTDEALKSIRVADQHIDLLSLSGQKTSGEEVTYTRREIATLSYLYHHRERPVPRDELLAKVWGYANTDEMETRTVDIHIAKLRRKIEVDPKSPRYIQTVRGGGYRLKI